MKTLSKIFKTFGLFFVLIAVFTLCGCEGSFANPNQLKTPIFTVLADDKKATVFIEQTVNADSYYLYVYSNDELKNKYSVSSNEALVGYTVYLNEGEYEFAAQAICKTGVYTDSLLSNRKKVIISGDYDQHVHEYVDGKCECGATDPSLEEGKVYRITYVLNGGIISNDAPVKYTSGETVFLLEPTRSNYSFGGWYLNSDFSGDKISVISNKTTGDIVIYAKWESNEYEYTGYYEDANDLTGTELKKSLRKIITTGFKTISYGDLRYKLPYTDASLEDESKMLLVYSHHEVNAAWDGAATWNREHVWPKSQGWFNEQGAGCDIHHIRPENTNVNSIRGNLAFGEITNGTAVNCCGEVVAYKNGSYFEPFDEFKGDVARIILYMLVRYSESDSYSITNVAQSMDMLLEWHEMDPVCEFEIQRNERCYSLQNNRNPFIDHPEFASLIWK